MMSPHSRMDFLPNASAPLAETEREPRELRATVKRLQQALEAAQLGTWVWERSSDRLELDDRAIALFGLPTGESLTRTELRQRIVMADDLANVRDTLEASLESGRTYQAEYRIGLPDGTTRWVYASGVPTYADGAGGFVTGMVGTVGDVTERKQQEQSLRDSEKLAATGRLAATIAHEINNPLEAVMNLIYLARTDSGVPVGVQQLLDTADAELARVSQLAQQTLGFYRDTTRLVLIDLNKLLLDSVELFARKMQSKSVQCSLEMEPDLRLMGLQGEIRQVFSNLLVNAIDASSHTPIRIRARRRRQGGLEGIVVVMTDRGEGIPAAVRPQLFTAFVTSKQTTGTGLGLWVTRGIVEKQGGSVRFRTRTETPTGTVFRVFLPLAPVAANDAAR